MPEGPVEYARILERAASDPHPDRGLLERDIEQLDRQYQAAIRTLGDQVVAAAGILHPEALQENRPLYARLFKLVLTSSGNVWDPQEAFREAQQLGLDAALYAEKTLERSISDEAFQQVHAAIFTKFRTNPCWGWNDPSRGKILHSDGIHLDISLSLYPRRDGNGSLFHELYLQTDLEAEKSNRDRNVTPENPYAILRTSACYSIRNINISPTNPPLQWTQGRSRDLLLYDLAVAFPTGMLPIGLTGVALLYGLRGSLDREIRARGEGIPQYQTTLAGLAPNVGSLPTDQRVTAQAPQAPRPATSTQQSQTPAASKGSPETNRFALIELE